MKKEESNVFVGAIGVVLRMKIFAWDKIKKLLDVLMRVKVQQNVGGVTKIV